MSPTFSRSAEASTASALLVVAIGGC